MRVGFDLDGVCIDFAQSVRDWLNACSCGPHYMEDGEVRQWHFYRDWNMSDEEFKRHCDDGVDAKIVFRGNIRPGTKEAFDRVRSLGHSIHIITDRSFGKTSYSSKLVTLMWLLENGLGYDSIDFSPDKTIVPTDMFVEDKLENYDALDKAGVDVYLINRPWNIQDDNRRRISCIADYADIVEAKTSLYASA